MHDLRRMDLRRFLRQRRSVFVVFDQSGCRLNDVQFFEAARKLAERVMLEGGLTPQSRIVYGFRLVTARPPDPSELGVLKRQYQTHWAEFQHDEPSARRIIEVGESPRDGSLDLRELAAWTMVANLILNLDETLTKR